MMLLEPHEKKRAWFMFGVMFPIMLLLQFLGVSTPIAAGVVAGVVGGLSVILFPRSGDPK